MTETSAAIESANLGSGSGSKQSNLNIANEKTTWLGRFNEQLSEWCSSILVKETRQALKSRQFIWTYLALMVCVGVWTVLGLATSYDDYDTGRELLFGFWVILGFPLGLIIPFSAYRSLAREFEDGTISLISITTMKPYQIVVGKFGSAILQMLIYLSVLAPCICFTYLLRGISIAQIGLGLSICVGGSICLTALGLFLAGVFRSRALGVGVSVLFVLLLGWLYFIWCEIIEELTRYGNASQFFNDPEAAIGVFAFVAFFGSMAILLLVTGASQISFPANNRSTAIRIAMFVQQILFFAMAIMLLPMAPEDEFACFLLLFAGHYWLVMGFLMIGESVFVSRRVQRSLPRTVFSRTFFSLFMPGAGRGFLFAVGNIWACAIFLLLVTQFSDLLLDDSVRQRFSGRRSLTGGGITPENLCQSIVSCLFVSWFLAVIYLLMRLFDRRKTQWSTGVGPTVSLVVGALFVAALSIGTYILHANLGGWRNNSNLTLPMVANWYGIVIELAESGFSGNMVRIVPLYLLFAVQKIVVIVIAIVVASRELLVKPIAVPERVQIEAQRPKPSLVPKGESIDEIFGELKPLSKEPADS